MKKFIKQNWTWILLFLYFIWPIDIIPDILAPVIGPIAYADDVTIVIIFLIYKYVNGRYFNKTLPQTNDPNKFKRNDKQVIDAE